MRTNMDIHRVVRKAQNPNLYGMAIEGEKSLHCHIFSQWEQHAEGSEKTQRREIGTKGWGELSGLRFIADRQNSSGGEVKEAARLEAKAIIKKQCIF